MTQHGVARSLRRVAAGIASGEVFPLDPAGVRLLLRALLFDGAGVPTWHALAACHGMDESVFFPPLGRDTAKRVAVAKRVCAGCPVRRECLDDALSWELPSTRSGVRGGLTARERSELPGHRTAVAA